MIASILIVKETVNAPAQDCSAALSHRYRTGAQSPDALLSDTRLSVHTLVREDIFAGFRNDNVERLARGERNIETLLKERPDQRANLLAWKAGATTFRAVRAHESGQAEEFSRRYAEALEDFAAAARFESGNDGVAAITGGTMAVFADRLPEKQRAAAWSLAYDNYSKLWKQQGPGIDKMPLHHKGEVLSGLTQSAQRTGRTEEVTLPRQDAHGPCGHAVRADGEAVEGRSGDRRDDQPDVQELSQPGRLANRLEALK